MPAPANMTYDSLVTDITSYTERTNDSALTDQIPRLIMMAENRLATDLKILGVQQIGQGTFTPSDPVLAKPALWRQSVSFRYQDANGLWQPLWLRTYEFCREFWPNQGTVTGTPRYYADYNYDQFLIVGTPASALNFELTYIAKLQPLSSSYQSNWLTTNAPQLLLAAALLETEIWLKNQTRVQQRQSVYDAALAAFKAQDGGRAFDRSVVVS